jgi:hypothetical protein
MVSKIEFKNIVLHEFDGDAEGEIQVYGEIGVYNVYKKKIIQTITTRNNLLMGLHPYPSNRLVIKEIDKNETDSGKLAGFKPTKDSKPYYLDLASGSRVHGRFTFNQKTVGKKYYGEDWKRIIYGSIIHTGCEHLRYKTINIIVTDDTLTDKNNRPLDDPKGNTHWFTGDSHAKASKALLEFLGFPLGSITGDIRYELNTTLQFRAAEFESWVGKGTIGWNADLDLGSFDLAIPISCMKGNKLSLGLHREKKLLIGKVFEAEQRKAKTGWMIWQWFKFSTLEADGIIQNMEDEASKLSRAYNDIITLAQLLHITEEEEEEDGYIDVEGEMSEAEYVSTMTKIVAADKHGILLQHPYIVDRVYKALQDRWLNLAKSCGVRFGSLMTQPDESLGHHYVTDAQGRIIGTPPCCAPNYREGEYIVFPNPMRHWGDIQIWRNYHEGQYEDAYGVIASTTEVMLSLGRDFDGDFLQLTPIERFPNVVEEIRNFTDAPLVDKLPKVPLSGSMAQIAINSMNDLTGVVASLLAKVRTLGIENVVRFIPPGGMQENWVDMRIIDFLSQELQIAVDSLKSAYPNNVAGLNNISDYVKELSGGDPAPWLKDFKDQDCYLTRVCAVDETANDTMSRIVKLVNSHWKRPSLSEISARKFMEIIFKEVAFTDAQLEYADSIKRQYWADMASALKWKWENDGDSTRTREVAQRAKDLVEDLDQMVNPETDKLYSRMSWASAFWYTCNDVSQGNAGLVFLMFTDEIIVQLEDVDPNMAEHFTVYGVQYSDAFAALDPFSAPWGELVVAECRVETLPTGNRNVTSTKSRIWIKYLDPDSWYSERFNRLGTLGDQFEHLVPVGSTRTMLLYGTHWTSDHQLKNCTLVDANLPETEWEKYVEHDT